MQYKITKAKLKDLERSLKVFREVKYPKKIDRKAMDAIKSLMDDLEKEIREYEKLKNEKVPTLALESLKDLPDILVRCRISQGMTQKQLADKLGMPATQIQRYESEDYRRVSFGTLLHISHTLKFDLDKGTRARINSKMEEKKVSKKINKITREQRIKRIESKLDCKLIKDSRATSYIDNENNIGVVFLVSREYEEGHYWFTFQPHQKEILLDCINGYLGLGCGFEKSIILIPIIDLIPWLDRVNFTERQGELRYHLHVDIGNDKDSIRTLKGLESIPILEYLI